MTDRLRWATAVSVSLLVLIGVAHSQDEDLFADRQVVGDICPCTHYVPTAFPAAAPFNGSTKAAERGGQG